MRMMAVRTTGIPSPIPHLIPTIRIMDQLNRLCAGVAEDVELVVGEAEAKAPRLEVAANICKAT